MRLLLLIILCCTLARSAYAQETPTVLLPVDSVPASDTGINKKKKLRLGVQIDTIRTDTAAVAALPREKFFHRFFVKKYPNPRAAALLSFLLPGAGQAYNKKWWKIPIVYGALGGMTWLALDNDKTYQGLKKNYKWLVDGDDNTNPTEAPYIYMSSGQMKSYRDQFRGYTEKSYLFLGITYLLAVTDAFVDAHLASFDVSDDLSLRLEPAIQSGAGGFGASFGVGIKLGFGNNTRPSAIAAKNIFATP